MSVRVLRDYSEQKRHRATLDKIRDAWLDGEITLRQKRQMIQEANDFYHGDQPAALTDARLSLVPGYEDEPELWWKREGA